jgi:hypothetical protein
VECGHQAADRVESGRQELHSLFRGSIIWSTALTRAKVYHDADEGAISQRQ